MSRTPPLNPTQLQYFDQLYSQFQVDPNSVDPSWRYFFEGFEYQSDTDSAPTSGQPDSAEAQSDTSKEVQVYQLIQAYRSRGHLLSKTNPIRTRRDHKPLLDLSDFGLDESDLEQSFQAGQELGLGNATLKQILATLQQIYTGHLGFEYTSIREPERLHWLRDKIEKSMQTYQPSLATKKQILKKLNQATAFEEFLGKKFVGQKRFSLEGGENTIPALDLMIREAADSGASEVIIGMAHRGRLNVLANIIGKTYEQIFKEFEGVDNPDHTMGDGDVKYHIGYTSQFRLDNGKELLLKLAPNPSHLEAVNSVVTGYTRAQIDDEYAGDFNQAIPILIHGDAAIAGQGVVYELIQMSELDGYHCGGTIHFVINNQIGFTTDFFDARSSIYCTDVAKIIDAPVLHVNGDDAEAVAFVAQLAIEYRQTFHRDIFIDMVCYRRHGHNEGDEPKFTQPQFYRLIGKHATPREIYNQTLIERGDVDAKLAEEMQDEYRQLLQARLDELHQEEIPYVPTRLEEEWHELSYAKPEDFDVSPDTAISEALLQQIGKALTTLPEDFNPLKKAGRILKYRQEAFFEKQSLDWASAELLAMGSILADGKIVRMSGQDVIRATFSQRHAMVFDAKTSAPYCPLNHISSDQPRQLQIYNSLLSEYAVMGFEYGYAMATPQALVIWEAQFGDFANGAQVMIDQFVSSAESKWQRMNGLVLLLPHGYEGQGPEHSNARPERFLQLAADNNMVVANITEPANYFHLLRRQLAWPFRKPCTVMTPKSLLRHPRCVSPLAHFSTGRFQEVLDDPTANPDKVQRLLLCSGKIYYDLLEAREAQGIDNVAIVRVEQLAPFPKARLEAIFERYHQVQSRCWVQEEPENMGYWAYILRMFRDANLEIISRRTAASPATGYHKQHKQEQDDIIQRALSIAPDQKENKA